MRRSHWLRLAALVVYLPASAMASKMIGRLLEPQIGRAWVYGALLMALVFGCGAGWIMVGGRMGQARHATIYTVVVDDRMVHYGTDQDEAELLAKITGGIIEPVAEYRWYSTAEFAQWPARTHPADRDIAREFLSWQIQLDEAAAAGEAPPPLVLTGPPFLDGQLRTADRQIDRP